MKMKDYINNFTTHLNDALKIGDSTSLKPSKIEFKHITNYDIYNKLLKSN